MIPRVVDISHHNMVSDFGLTKEAGIWGLIHKATQGTAYVDPNYETRRKLWDGLWGAYHFNTGDDVQSQVDWFMLHANPDEKTLMVLDYEDNRLSNMNINQLVEFCHALEERLGHKCTIYSGNRIKETIGQLGPADLTYVTSHKLWLCQYGPNAVLPKGFSDWWLWQYTGDGIGPLPHSIPGIQGDGVDLNAFDGSQQELADSWAQGIPPIIAAHVDVPKPIVSQSPRPIVPKPKPPRPPQDAFEQAAAAALAEDRKLT
jgi:lysozyme